MCICGRVIDGRDKYRTYLSEVATYSLLFRFCDANGLPLFSPSNEVLGVLFHSTGHNPPPRQDIRRGNHSRIIKGISAPDRNGQFPSQQRDEASLPMEWGSSNWRIFQPCLITQKHQWGCGCWDSTLLKRRRKTRWILKYLSWKRLKSGGIFRSNVPMTRHL